MRKIKKLEERIDELEKLERCNERIRMNNDNLLYKIESKQKEQEEFLKKTVAPFIAKSLEEELDKSLTGLAAALADLFAEEPNKKIEKESKDEKKKVGRPKQKKENK